MIVGSETYCSENVESLSILAEITGKLVEARLDEWGKTREEVELTIDELEGWIEAMEATETYSICLSGSDRESFIGDVRRKGCSFEFGFAAFIEWSDEMPERAIWKMRPPEEDEPESRVMRTTGKDQTELRSRNSSSPDILWQTSRTVIYVDSVCLFLWRPHITTIRWWRYILVNCILWDEKLDIIWRRQSFFVDYVYILRC